MAKKLVIQIPCFNEEQILNQTLADLPKQIPGIDQIILLVINDGSNDQTEKIALENGVNLILRHNQNRGLAKAFMSGIQTSLALGADIIVNTDADNQYPGKYIPELIAPILNKQADIVIGNRQPGKNIHFSPIKQLLEEFGSRLIRLLSKTDAPDAPSGYRAFSRYAALRLHVYNSYSYTLETLILAGRERMRIKHLPINTNPSYRPSRLHQGIINFIWRQSGVIIRSYVLYQPLKTFGSLSIPFLISGSFLVARFLFYYLVGDSGIGRFSQSVSIGGTLIIFGLLLCLLGLVGDAIRSNRQTTEEILVCLRDEIRLSEDADEFLGSLIIKNK